MPLSIDHLGMTPAGMPVLLDLVAAGVKVKATGFGRVTMDAAPVLEAIAARDPGAPMFGSDMPLTRAQRRGGHNGCLTGHASRTIDIPL